MEKTELIEQRQAKLEEIENLGHEVYPHRYDLTHSVSRLVSDFGGSSTEELEAQPVEVKTAGRLMAVRGHGQAAFGDLSDGTGRIQLYIRKDAIGEDNFRLYQALDLGDIIGVRGKVSRTRTGELTVFVKQLDFLAKSLIPLPEKWHGLTDVETRYRHRYLDLIANPEVREIFVRRSRLISEIRRFLEERDFLEVETPMMQPIAGGATARPFRTFHEALGIPLYLRVAPELYLKRLVVGGFHRVFEINRNFRNEGISTQHNPEFTMLEFYQAFSDYRDLMDLTEDLLRTVVKNITAGLEVPFGDDVINFDVYQRLSMVEAIRHFWKWEDVPSPEQLDDREFLLKALGSFPIEVNRQESWGKLLAALFEEVTEKQLIQPTFIYDFPVEVSPLSKRKPSDPRFTERFELFVGGFEVANAYSELNDPNEQRQRFEEQLQARARGDMEAHEMDEDYVRALGYGMPPTAGEGIGIDRLAMILTNSRSIREVILFPHLRPQS